MSMAPESTVPVQGAAGNPPRGHQRAQVTSHQRKRRQRDLKSSTWQQNQVGDRVREGKGGRQEEEGFKEAGSPRVRWTAFGLHGNHLLPSASSLPHQVCTEASWEWSQGFLERDCVPHGVDTAQKKVHQGQGNNLWSDLKTRERHNLQPEMTRRNQLLRNSKKLQRDTDRNPKK